MRFLGACYLAVHVLSCVLAYVPMSVCIGFPIAVEIVLPCRYYKPAAFGTGDGGCAIAVIGVCDMLESCRSGYRTADRAQYVGAAVAVILGRLVSFDAWIENVGRMPSHAFFG